MNPTQTAPATTPAQTLTFALEGMARRLGGEGRAAGRLAEWASWVKPARRPGTERLALRFPGADPFRDGSRAGATEAALRAAGATFARLEVVARSFTRAHLNVTVEAPTGLGDALRRRVAELTAAEKAARSDRVSAARSAEKAAEADRAARAAARKVERERFLVALSTALGGVPCAVDSQGRVVVDGRTTTVRQDHADLWTAAWPAPPEDRVVEEAARAAARAVK